MITAIARLLPEPEIIDPLDALTCGASALVTGRNRECPASDVEEASACAGPALSELQVRFSPAADVARQALWYLANISQVRERFEALERAAAIVLAHSNDDGTIAGSGKAVTAAISTLSSPVTAYGRTGCELLNLVVSDAKNAVDELSRDTSLSRMKSFRARLGSLLSVVSTTLDLAAQDPSRLQERAQGE